MCDVTLIVFNLCIIKIFGRGVLSILDIWINVNHFTEVENDVGRNLSLPSQHYYQQKTMRKKYGMTRSIC